MLIKNEPSDFPTPTHNRILSSRRRRDLFNPKSTIAYSYFQIIFWAGTSPLVPSSVQLQPFFLPIPNLLIQNSAQAEKNVNIGRSLSRFSSSFKVHRHQSPHPGFTSSFKFPPSNIKCSY